MKIFWNIIFFICFIPSLIFAQIQHEGMPFYDFYPMESYGSPHATWCISEDWRGFIYVASDMGLLEYDGCNWRTYYVDNSSGIRAVYADSSDRVYVGAVQTFGYFEADSGGYLRFKSLCSLLTKSDLNFSDIWQVKECNTSIFFHSMLKLFRYNPIDNSLFTYKSETDFQLMGVYNNQLYLGQTGIGLCKVNGDSVILVKGGEFFKNKTIYNILPFDDDNVMITTKFEIFIFNVTLGKINTSLTKRINSNLKFDIERFYSAFKLSGDRFGIATLNSGVYLFNKEGNIQKHFSNDNILPSNVLYYGLEAKNGNIWLGIENGVFKFENSLPFSKLEYNRKNPLPVNWVIQFRNEIYFTTNQGLFSKNLNISDKKKSDYPKNIGNSTFRCFGISYYFDFSNGKTDTSLLIPSEEGLFLLRGRDFIPLTNKFVFMVAQQSNLYRDNIYLSTNKGFAFLKYPSSKFSDIEYIPQVKSIINKIVEDNQGNIWLSTTTDGFYYLKRIGNSFKVLYHFEQQDERRSIDYAYSKGDEIYYIYANELWSFNFKTFEIINSQHILPSEVNKWWLTPQSVYNDSTIWFSLYDENKQIPFQVIGRRSPKYNALFERLSGLSIRNVHQVSNDKVWFGSSNGVICAQNFNECKLFNIKPKIYIRNIKINNDSVIFDGAGSVGFYSSWVKDSIASIEQSISYNNNKVTITVSSPFLLSEQKNLYSHFLVGYEKGWSDWSSVNTINYSNLPHGDYTLQVKVRNVFGVESSISKIHFKIMPPWYRTIYVHLGGTLIILLFIFIIYNEVQKRHKIEKYKLEKIINQRTSEIINQKTKIISQNKLLDISNKSLQQLSFVAQETNNPVIITNHQGEIEWLNKSFYNYCDFSLDGGVKAKVSDLFKNSDIDERIKTCINQKNAISFLGQFSTNRAVNIWFQVTINPIIDDTGNITNLIMVCSDVTNVIELNNTRDLIISVITHDLKSPLLGFKMMAKSLSENIDSIERSKIKEWVSTMHTNSSDIYELIENLTQWFKSQRGIITFSPTLIDLHFTVNEVFAIFEPHATTKGIRLANLIKNDTRIIADENMIRTILRNLISNAIKFTDMGMVCVSAEDLCDEFKISITDEGRGLDEEILAKLNSEQYNESIGLMICKEFLHKNGGRLIIQSSPDGATFSFILQKLFMS